MAVIDELSINVVTVVVTRCGEDGKSIVEYMDFLLVGETIVGEGSELGVSSVVGGQLKIGAVEAKKAGEGEEDNAIREEETEDVREEKGNTDS